MAISPIEEILDVSSGWRSQFLDTGYWGDLQNFSESKPYNAIIDAEICLTFLLTQAGVDRLKLSPSNSAKDIGALANFYERLKGDDGEPTKSKLRLKIAQRLVEYFERHLLDPNDPSSEQLFDSTDYMIFDDGVDLSEEKYVTVDAYALSLSAALYSKIFALRQLEEREGSTPDPTWLKLVDLAHNRISASLKGLLSGFAIFQLEEDEFEHLSGRGWPFQKRSDSGWSAQQLRQRDKCLQILREVKIALKAVGYEIDSDEGTPYECGWAWAPIADSGILPKARFSGGSTEDVDRYVRDSVLKEVANVRNRSESSPYLYFTINAIDSIDDLNSDFIDDYNLLDSDQMQYAGKLIRLRGLAVDYWYAISTMPAPSTEKVGWQLETMPWYSTAGDSSHYFNLYLARIALGRKNISDSDIRRLTSFISRLTEIGRITSPPNRKLVDGTMLVSDDNLNDLHNPGLKISLFGEDESVSSAKKWLVYDFSPQLLKLTAQVSARANSAEVRVELADLIERIWTHLKKRQIVNAEGSLWDVPNAAWPQIKSKIGRKKLDLESEEQLANIKVASWYFTERVCEALIAVWSATSASNLVSAELVNISVSLVAELQKTLSDFREKGVVGAETMSELNESFDQGMSMASTQPGSSIAILLNLAERIHKLEGSDS